MNYQSINEAKLNLRELDVRGELGKRGDMLVHKIKEDEPLLVSKIGSEKKEIIVVNKEQVLHAITSKDGTYNSYKASKYFTKPEYPARYKEDAILGDDGIYYKLNDFEKTSHFGSSRGASLGSLDTRYVESIMCVFLAWRQLKRVDLDEADILDILEMRADIFEDFKHQYCSMDSGLNLSQQDIEKYWENWKESFINIPNFLYYPGIIHSGFKNEYLLLDTKVYRFCQLSSSTGAVKALRIAFQKRYPGLNFAKWNPSDIFAVELNSEKEIETKLNSCKSNAKLNEIIDKSFDIREMVGVSLKKIKKKSDLKIIVNKVTKPPKYFLDTIRLSRLPFATLGLELIANRRSREFGSGSEVMVIRTRERNKLVNISAEVRGKTAKHGNMSLTQINKILDSYGLELVPSVTSRSETYYGNSLEEWTEAELKREILAINKKIIENYGSIIEPKNLAIEVDRIRLISKYQSLFLAWILMEAQSLESEKEGKTVADCVVEEMFHFALSINITPGKESGRTPRYARIID